MNNSPAIGLISLQSILRSFLPAARCEPWCALVHLQLYKERGLGGAESGSMSQMSELAEEEKIDKIHERKEDNVLGIRTNKMETIKRIFAVL